MVNPLIDFAVDFADLLDSWTGSRAAAGADNSEGVFVPGVAVPLSFRATPPQPINQNDLVQDEGGEFRRSVVKTYTSAVLLINDRLTYAGTVYEVHQIDERQPLGTYQKVYLVKVQNDN
jgi:hypothetical protein